MPNRPFLSDNSANICHMIHCGDNLQILRELAPDACIDLVYLDPPFNTGRSYQYRHQNHTVTFSDAWQWNETAQIALDNLLAAEDPLADCLGGFSMFLKKDNLLAYLVMMAARLAELRRVMKNTATVYLHVDAAASHYLKLIMDALFGRKNFRNEIVWKRTAAHNTAKLFGRIHDTILCYTKGKKFTSNRQCLPYDDAYLKSKFSRADAAGRRYAVDSLAARKTKPPYVYKWNEIMGEFRKPAETMRKLAERNRLHYSKNGLPSQIRYLDEMVGAALQDVWVDIAPVGSAAERMGYPTQKPQALLERIIRASSNPGDLVLDPFCGCGTTIAAAHRLNRRAIGIDINPDAVAMARARLESGGNFCPGKSQQIQYQLSF